MHDNNIITHYITQKNTKLEKEHASNKFYTKKNKFKKEEHQNTNKHGIY